MIKKLKIKFVLVNMSIVTVMLLVIFGMILGSTSADLERQSIRIMQFLLEERKFPVNRPGQTSESVQLPFFRVTLDHKAEDDEIHWYYDGEEIDMDSFESAVINLIADEFTEEKPTGKEEISVTFHLNNENFPTVLIDRVYAVDLIEAVLAIVL